MLTLDHVVFPVRDAKATLGFYRDLLGLPLTSAITGDDWGGHAWLMMIFRLAEDRELVTVALRGASPPDYAGLPSDVRHYALAAASADELDATAARLAAADVESWEERHGARRSLYFPDPDGVIIELTWPRSDAGPTASGDAEATVEWWLTRERSGVS